MSLTPVELRHVKLRRRPLGVAAKEARRVLAEATQSFEECWADRETLRERVERLELDLTRYQDIERLLRETLMTAERTAEDHRAQARRESDAIVQEARVRAREVLLEAESERERIRAELRRLEAFESETRASLRGMLLSALERLDTSESCLQVPHHVA